MGQAIEIEDTSAVRWAELPKHNMGHSERLLFKTWSSQRCWNSSEFVSEFVSLAEDAANLAELKTLAPGIDDLSMGRPEVHRTLPRAGEVIVEGWNLSKVRLGEYEFFCLPLRIRGGDGLPLAPC
jgi:arylformamidase